MGMKLPIIGEIETQRYFATFCGKGNRSPSTSMGTEVVTDLKRRTEGGSVIKDEWNRLV